MARTRALLDSCTHAHGSPLTLKNTTTRTMSTSSQCRTKSKSVSLTLHTCLQCFTMAIEFYIDIMSHASWQDIIGNNNVIASWCFVGVIGGWNWRLREGLTCWGAQDHQCTSCWCRIHCLPWSTSHTDDPWFALQHVWIVVQVWAVNDNGRQSPISTIYNQYTLSITEIFLLNDKVISHYYFCMIILKQHVVAKILWFLVVFISACLVKNCYTKVLSTFREGKKGLIKIYISDTPLRCPLPFLIHMIRFFPHARGWFPSCAYPRESSARAS